MKPYLASVTIKNNNIVSLIERQGFSNVAQFCKHHQIPQVELGRYINLKKSPLDRNMKWKAFVLKVAAALNVSPGELFTDEQFYPLENNRGSVEMDASDIQVLLGGVAGDPLDRMLEDELDVSGRVAEILSGLPSRSRKILEMRFGLNGQKEHTLKEVGAHFDVCGQRIRDLEHKALRQIRLNPARRDYLQEVYAA